MIVVFCTAIVGLLKLSFVDLYFCHCNYICSKLKDVTQIVFDCLLGDSTFDRLRLAGLKFLNKILTVNKMNAKFTKFGAIFQKGLLRLLDQSLCFNDKKTIVGQAYNALTHIASLQSCQHLFVKNLSMVELGFEALKHERDKEVRCYILDLLAVLKYLFEYKKVSQELCEALRVLLTDLMHFSCNASIKDSDLDNVITESDDKLQHSQKMYLMMLKNRKSRQRQYDSDAVSEVKYVAINWLNSLFAFKNAKIRVLNLLQVENCNGRKVKECAIRSFLPQTYQFQYHKIATKFEDEKEELRNDKYPLFEEFVFAAVKELNQVCI